MGTNAGVGSRLGRCEPGGAVIWTGDARWQVWDTQGRNWVALRGPMDRRNAHTYAARDPQRYRVFMLKSTTRAVRADRG